MMMANPQGSSALSAMSDFQIFMTLIGSPDAGETAARCNAVVNVLTILIPGYSV